MFKEPQKVTVPNAGIKPRWKPKDQEHVVDVTLVATMKAADARKLSPKMRATLIGIEDGHMGKKLTLDLPAPVYNCAFLLTSDGQPIAKGRLDRVQGPFSLTEIVFGEKKMVDLHFSLEVDPHNQNAYPLIQLCGGTLYLTAMPEQRDMFAEKAHLDRQKKRESPKQEKLDLGKDGTPGKKGPGKKTPTPKAVKKKKS